MTGEKRLKPWKVEVRLEEEEEVWLSLKKRRLEESGVAGKLVEVELAPNVLLLVRDDGNKGVKAAVVEIEPTTVVEDMFQFFQNSDTVPLSLSLSLREDFCCHTNSFNQHRTFVC